MIQELLTFTKNTQDFGNTTSSDELEGVESSNYSDEVDDEFPEWMDYPSDKENEIVLDHEKLTSHNMQAEAELHNKYMKEQRKARLQTPASQ